MNKHRDPFVDRIDIGFMLRSAARKGAAEKSRLYFNRAAPRYVGANEEAQRCGVKGWRGNSVDGWFAILPTAPTGGFMLKSDLIRRISSRQAHLYERDVDKIVNAILDQIVEALRRGDRVELRGFGAFSAKLRGPRQGRNPRTGAVVSVAQKAVPFFKTGKEMRERLNRETGSITSSDQLGKEPKAIDERDEPQ